jgi:predicted dehydrogenase
MTRPNRRDFLKHTSVAATGLWIAGTTSTAESRSPNERLNIGIIGAGGKGASNLGAVSGENIVALCDVDEKRAAKAFERYPQAKKYHDFRKLLEEQKNLDAVVVSTPDHCHAAASVMAMKLGKHVYCEKPLTRDVFEARVMRETAAKCKVATQMGNQGTSTDGLRRGVEVIRSGVLGPVREVHVWTNRPIWPQGMLHRPPEVPEVPKTLDWDLWLGPAPERPYSPAYAPFAWRGWWDFGTGALGDMACHTANLPFLALKLGYPSAIEAESAGNSPESPPKWSVIHFEFPARDEMPPVKLIWYDGGKKPATKLLKGQKLSDSGSLVVGEKGSLLSPDDYGEHFKLLEPVLTDAEVERLGSGARTLPRVHGQHHREWIRACKGGPPAMSNFDYAGLLTETILLGNVALRVGKRLEWDGASMKALNCPEADQYLRREYRPGWTL